MAQQDSGKGRPNPPDFLVKEPKPMPLWMQYEQKVEEPLSAVTARLKQVGNQPFQIDTIQYNGVNAIDIVLMGDGYTDVEQEKFSRDAKRCISYLFEISPFNRYVSFFNVYALHVLSQESGISHPGVWQANEEGTHTMRCPENSKMPIITKKTFFGVSLDGWGVHRLTGMWNKQNARDLLRVYFPKCKVPGILSNTEEYGGAGGEILIATCNGQSSEIYVHEFAHLFGDLADEYFGGDVYIDEKPNMSRKGDSLSVRWRHWLDDEEVGIYPHHGSRQAEKTFKPTQATETSKYCKMEKLGKEFCPVCRERLVEAIHEQVNLIESASPLDTVLAPLSKSEKLTFSLEKIYRAKGNRCKITWFVDGKLWAADTTRISLSGKELTPEKAHIVEVCVEDVCSFVRTGNHETFHTSKHRWNIARKR
ncbi:MAG: hypothetical protein IJ605_03885 [Prevotella sp.]|nr:hypothetical protein [Prevotella sp.]